MAAMEKERVPHFVCVECGDAAQELYKEYPSQIIKVSYCESCQSMVDQYITFDPVIIFLDALLLKAQAYRHLLFNVSITSPWKLLLIFLLCDSYLKWDNLHGNGHSTVSTDQHAWYAALEWEFYRMFILSAVEWVIFVALVLLVLWLLRRLTPHLSRGRAVHRALVLSSFGKLLAVPATIWGQTHSPVYLLLARVFVFTSNVSALRVITGSGRIFTTVVVATAAVCQILCGQQLTRHVAGS